MAKNPMFNLAFTVMGIYCIYQAIKKPDSFWESERVIRFRKIFGDKGATYFYTILGVLMIVGSIAVILIEYGYIRI